MTPKELAENLHVAPQIQPGDLDQIASLDFDRSFQIDPTANTEEVSRRLRTSAGKHYETVWRFVIYPLSRTKFQKTT